MEKINKKKAVSKIDRPVFSKMVYISYPQQTGNDGLTKRYYVMARYQDLAKKEHTKKIFFGQKGVHEFIDHKDPMEREKMLKKVKTFDHPLKSNFYRVRLLNGGPSLKENYFKLLEDLNIAV